MNSLLRSPECFDAEPIDEGVRAVPGPRPATVALSRLGLDCPAIVCGIDTTAAGQPQERARQLRDIGFVPGERVVVLTRAWPGRDPLVVLVGHSRFALRLAEAACIQVQETA